MKEKLIAAALMIASTATGVRVSVAPGDAFQDSLLTLGAGDTLFFNPGTYSRNDDLPLLHVLPANDGVVITSDSLNRAVLDGAGRDRPVVVVQGPIGSGTVLSNLVLTGGSSLSGTWFGGGGLCITNGECVVRNLTVSGNTALMGGGVFCEGGSPDLSGLLIENNTALVSGGGVCFYGSDVLLSHSVVRLNTSEDDGGGVYAYQGDTFARNVLLHDNHAGDDGGAFMQLRGRLLMQFCTLHDNFSGDDGGGILVSSCDSLSMESCIVTQNQGKGGVQLKRGDEAVFISHSCSWDNEYGNYVNMEDPTGTLGNISEDPLYADSLLRLSQTSSGQPAQSPCTDAGHVPADGSIVQWFSTRTDSIPDQGTADMGFHFNPLPYLWNPEPPPLAFMLRVYPCPTTGPFTIMVGSLDSALVELSVFDLAGRLVAGLGSLMVSAGETELLWNVPSEIPAGVLFVRCTGPGGVVVARTVVLR
ncbi:MAG: right-handed parallel beta-helix repeat-containing protein [Candidatus Fermentibacteraceae bacterium]